MNDRNIISNLWNEISKFVDKKISEKQSDKTFKSVIWKINENNTFSINYKGQLYNVPNASGVSLNLGQTVWIKIPDGILRNMYIESVPNAVMSGSSGGKGSIYAFTDYKTEEHRVGTWMDGRPIYQNCLIFDDGKTFNNTTDITDDLFSSIDNIIGGEAYRDDSDNYTQCFSNVDAKKINDNTFRFYVCQTDSPWHNITHLFIRYTKTSDAPSFYYEVETVSTGNYDASIKITKYSNSNEILLEQTYLYDTITVSDFVVFDNVIGVNYNRSSLQWQLIAQKDLLDVGKYIEYPKGSECGSWRYDFIYKGRFIINENTNNILNSNILYGKEYPTNNMGKNGYLYYQYEEIKIVDGYVNSELGWYAKEEYVRTTTDRLCTINGRGYYKTNEGASVVAVYTPTNGFTAPGILSTVPEYAGMRSDVGGMQTYEVSFEYEGFLWYFRPSEHGYQNGSVSNEIVNLGATGYDDNDEQQAIQTGVYILEQAGVINKSKISGNIAIRVIAQYIKIGNNWIRCDSSNISSGTSIGGDILISHDNNFEPLE